MKKSLPNSHNKAHAIVLCILCLFVSTTFGQQRNLVEVFEEIAAQVRDDRLAEAETGNERHGDASCCMWKGLDASRHATTENGASNLGSATWGQ